MTRRDDSRATRHLWLCGTPDLDPAEEALASWEAQGLICRTGEYRRGQPVFVAAEHSGQPVTFAYGPEGERVMRLVTRDELAALADRLLVEVAAAGAVGFSPDIAVPHVGPVVSPWRGAFDALVADGRVVVMGPGGSGNDWPRYCLPEYAPDRV